MLAISSEALPEAIESAQKKVEGNNFDIRKNLTSIMMMF